MTPHGHQVHEPGIDKHLTQATISETRLPLPASRGVVPVMPAHAASMVWGASAPLSHAFGTPNTASRKERNAMPIDVEVRASTASGIYMASGMYMTSGIYMASDICMANDIYTASDIYMARPSEFSHGQGRPGASQVSAAPMTQAGRLYKHGGILPDVTHVRNTMAHGAILATHPTPGSGVGGMGLGRVQHQVPDGTPPRPRYDPSPAALPAAGTVQPGTSPSQPSTPGINPGLGHPMPVQGSHTGVAALHPLSAPRSAGGSPEKAAPNVQGRLHVPSAGEEEQGQYKPGSGLTCKVTPSRRQAHVTGTGQLPASAPAQGTKRPAMNSSHDALMPEAKTSRQEGSSVAAHQGPEHRAATTGLPSVGLSRLGPEFQCPCPHGQIRWWTRCVLCAHENKKEPVPQDEAKPRKKTRCLHTPAPRNFLECMPSALGACGEYKSVEHRRSQIPDTCAHGNTRAACPTCKQHAHAQAHANSGQACSHGKIRSECRDCHELGTRGGALCSCDRLVPRRTCTVCCGQQPSPFGLPGVESRPPISGPAVRMPSDAAGMGGAVASVSLRDEQHPETAVAASQEQQVGMRPGEPCVGETAGDGQASVHLGVASQGGNNDIDADSGTDYNDDVVSDSCDDAAGHVQGTEGTPVLLAQPATQERGLCANQQQTNAAEGAGMVGMERPAWPSRLSCDVQGNASDLRSEHPGSSAGPAVSLPMPAPCSSLLSSSPAQDTVMESTTMTALARVPGLSPLEERASRGGAKLGAEVRVASAQVASAQVDSAQVDSAQVDSAQVASAQVDRDPDQADSQPRDDMVAEGDMGAPGVAEAVRNGLPQAQQRGKGHVLDGKGKAQAGRGEVLPECAETLPEGAPASAPPAVCTLELPSILKNERLTSVPGAPDWRYVGPACEHPLDALFGEDRGVYTADRGNEDVADFLYETRDSKAWEPHRRAPGGVVDFFHAVACANTGAIFGVGDKIQVAPNQRVQILALWRCQPSNDDASSGMISWQLGDGADEGETSCARPVECPYPPIQEDIPIGSIIRHAHSTVSRLPPVPDKEEQATPSISNVRHLQDDVIIVNSKSVRPKIVIVIDY
eukprot:jgi/Mesvir1/17325/Mv07717-RA.2